MQNQVKVLLRFQSSAIQGAIPRMKYFQKITAAALGRSDHFESKDRIFIYWERYACRWVGVFRTISSIL